MLFITLGVQSRRKRVITKTVLNLVKKININGFKKFSKVRTE